MQKSHIGLSLYVLSETQVRHVAIEKFKLLHHVLFKDINVVQINFQNRSIDLSVLMISHILKKLLVHLLLKCLINFIIFFKIGFDFIVIRLFMKFLEAIKIEDINFLF